MCTVTFIPVKDKYFITSNRDEKKVRKPALAPTTYQFKNAKLIYPKDADAGGTWIAMHENGNAIVLLNGCFTKHISVPPYTRSRGVILLEIISTASPLVTFMDLVLAGIEPFTVVLLDDGNLYDCRWDGDKKHSKQLDKTKPHIWSSVTLYDEKVIQLREQWFEEWLSKNTNPSMQDILDFHLFAGEGDNHNDLRMNRNGMMLTLSTTGIELNNENAIMYYLDLNNNKIYKQELRFASSYAL
ncbi:MAG: NRDE family protein [Panacibacter sp.]